MLPPSCSHKLAQISCALLAALMLQGCSEDRSAGNAGRQGSTKRTTTDSPEEQFRRVRKSELGPNMKIGTVVMNVKRVNGNEVVYGGFYTLMFDERLGLIGDKPETFFFHALYRDGRLVGWTPD